MRIRLRVLALLLVSATLVALSLSHGTSSADAQGSFDRELIRLANEHRAGLGRPPLATSSSLSSGALSWSQTMLRTGNFKHAPNLGNLGENIAFSHGPVGRLAQVAWERRAGRLPSYCTNNMDVTTAKFIMCVWLDSSGHRRAIESTGFRQIGSGTATGPGSFGRKTYSTFRFSSQAPANPTPTPTPVPPANLAEPGHSVASNTDGDVVTVSMKSNGVLWARRNLGSGWSAWVDLGAGRWASADVTMSPNGTTHVAALKQDGRLFTQQWTPSGAWTGWVSHGSGWDPDTMPSISSNASSTLLGAIGADGRLVTKFFRSSWGAATSHGAPSWAHVDVDIADDGDLWFVGVKTDGRLYLRKHLGNGWSGFGAMGVATWSADTPPAVAARSNGVIFGAVKADGRLYTREQVNGRWSDFVRHGISSWKSIDIAMNERGAVWLAAHKTWGRLYTHERTAAGSWRPWGTQGLDTWAPDADASIAIGSGDRPVLLAVKQNGLLYYRPHGATGWGTFSALGAGRWAPGT